ncbi:hypothetical protein ACHQM5_006912 [Ranunculus cassubicifolius]
MASQSHKLSFCFFFLLLLVHPWSCTSTRSGGMMIGDSAVKLQVGVPRQVLVLNFFPKGKKTPPSGPSKRHNNVVNSNHN